MCFKVKTLKLPVDETKICIPGTALSTATWKPITHASKASLQGHSSIFGKQFMTENRDMWKGMLKRSDDDVTVYAADALTSLVSTFNKHDQELKCLKKNLLKREKRQKKSNNDQGVTNKASFICVLMSELDLGGTQWPTRPGNYRFKHVTLNPAATLIHGHIPQHTAVYSQVKRCHCSQFVECLCHPCTHSLHVFPREDDPVQPLGTSCPLTTH